MRISREIFKHLLQVVHDNTVKQPTNFDPNLTMPDRQLAMTLYRLAHEASFSTIGDLFVVSNSLAATTFNKLIRLLIVMLCDMLKLPSNDQEWEAGLQGFIENYEFLCVGAWDGFHVYVSSKLKSFFSFKKRYTMTNLTIIGYNKRFLYAAVGATGMIQE